MRTIPRPPGWAALGAVVALASAGCSPIFDWRDVRFPEAGGAQALFPCKPDRVARQVRLAGDAVSFALASCSAGGVTFALAHAEVTDAASGLAALAEAAAANVGGPAREGPRPAVPGASGEPPPRRLSMTGRRPDGGAL